MTRTVLLPVLFIFSILCFGGDSWKQPPASWDESDTLEVLNKSPWVVRQDFTRVSSPHYVDGQKTTRERVAGGRVLMVGPSGVKGNTSRENEVHYRYTLRLLSEPVGEAYNRLNEIEKGYDRMSAEQKSAFRAERQGIVRDPNTIVVLLELSTNDRETGLELERQFRQPSLNNIRQDCHLISEQVGKIPLLSYSPAPSNGLYHRFVFPRIVDGKEVVGPADSKLAFALKVPVTSDKIYAVWDLKKMQYRGQLAY